MSTPRPPVIIPINERAKRAAGWPTLNQPPYEVSTMSQPALVQTPEFTPANTLAQLSALAKEIVELLRQRTEIGEAIRAKYQEAHELGAPKGGFRLATAHSRLDEEKLEDIRRGYRAGADALGLQLDLFAQRTYAPPIACCSL